MWIDKHCSCIMSVCFLIHEQMTFVYLFMDCKALSVHPFHLDNIFMQPGPRDAPMKCFIVRNRTTQTYYLYIGLTDGMFFLFYIGCNYVIWNSRYASC